MLHPCNRVFTILTILLCLLFSTQLPGQQTLLSLGGGISKVSSGTSSENINLGYNGTAILAFKTANRIYLGGSFAYNNFGVNSDDITNIIPGLDLSLTFSVLAISPLIRFIPLEKESRLQPFVQFGVGFYQVKLKASGNDNSVNEALAGTRDVQGLSMGLGLASTSRSRANLEISPTLHWVFDDGERLTYFTLNLAVMIN